MPTLVPIGRFAQRTGLTIKALRLYDKLGLLRPALVDFTSGFRYYSQDQVADAERIRLLRSLDMPLEDIRAFLSAPDPETIRGRLARQRARIETTIAQSRRALSLLAAVEKQWATQSKESTMTQESKESKSYRCSFCGKGNADVRRLIAGPNGVFICNECVATCNAILAEEEARV